MATANAAATLERANDFSADFTSAILTIKVGATVLATHTLAGFVTSNSGANALATANAIPNETIVGDGVANVVELTAAGKTYVLVIGSDITLTPNNYITGETSSVSGIVVTFPA
jgi:ABC-type Zn uptake system ZnuABC Zn-binding protein ZnuA